MDIEKYKFSKKLFAFVLIVTATTFLAAIDKVNGNVAFILTTLAGMYPYAQGRIDEIKEKSKASSD
jgi:hypothetical protein